MLSAREQSCSRGQAYMSLLQKAAEAFARGT